MKNTPISTNDSEGAVLGVAAVISIFIAAIYFIYAAYLGSIQIVKNIFELSLFGFIFETVSAVIVLGVLSLGAYLLIHAITALFARNSNRQIISGIRGTAAVVILIWFFGCHFYTSHALSGLKLQFNNIVASEQPKLVPRADPDARGSDFSYGGKLDAIIAERDQYLRSHGYRQLFVWDTGSLTAIYVHTGF